MIVVPGDMQIGPKGDYLRYCAGDSANGCV